ncbi:MAG: hypothetical protein KJ607_05680 [Bacteroidetes bacterium]|nr:hypothetical protein [Bacteroidota bacterium]
MYSGTRVCLYVDYFIYVFLKYFDENIVITILHNGWNDMAGETELDLTCNERIPTRIKNLIRTKKLTCLLTGETIKISDGKFRFALKKKSAMVLKML